MANGRSARPMPEEANTVTEVNQTTEVAWGTYEASGFGTLWLTWSAHGLREVLFERPKAPPTLDDAVPIPARLTVFLDRYFAGEPVDVTEVAVDARGTDFQSKVWAALRKIPYGEVRTYESIAIEVGSPKAMRAVGMANNANPVPIVVPCHRVIEAGHRLGGFGGGVDRKRFLLELEGAQVEGALVRPGQLSLF